MSSGNFFIRVVGTDGQRRSGSLASRRSLAVARARRLVAFAGPEIAFVSVRGADGFPIFFAERLR